LNLSRTTAVFFVSLLILTGCATQKTVDSKEPRRVLGTEENVRVDAQIFGENLSANEMVHVAYEITNQRDTPIAIADLIPDASYDIETRTITINVGSEVPGNQLVPRRFTVASGEKKSFAGAARMPTVGILTGPTLPPPRFLRLSVHFLGETKPFEKLIDIPEKSIADPDLASTLFPTWVEHTESVYTNAVPIRWNAGNANDDFMSGGRRSRRRG
jgi:hypothetical protein